MPNYKIAGINVNFPYDAYDCQLVYMEHVIQSLQKGCNALLESPTGTGKTLCLLCATLAWRSSLKPTAVEKIGEAIGSKKFADSSQESEKPRKPTILYASRTHSQLQQVIRELKATSYRPKMIVLGSREQMCIHKDVQKLRGRVQNLACRAKCKERSCHHQNRVPDYMNAHPEIGLDPIDIEDLVNIGRTEGPCPYYLSRELHSTADIIFLPYNYLVDKENRKSLTGIVWEKTVLIFDEAHNLESLCADAASFDLPASHLTACILEARQCVDLALSHRGKDNGADASIDPDNFAVLKALLLELEKRINEVSMDSSDLGFTRPGPYIYEFLAAMKINCETATMLIDTIEQATSLLEDEAATGALMQGRFSGTNCRLHSLRDALNLIFQGADTTHAKFYKMHIHEVRNKDGDKGGSRGAGGKATSRTLSWWCFNPGVAMEEFSKLGVHSVILTSGTLAPLDSFAIELKLPFNVRLENPHVIDSSQIWVGVVPLGPSGRPLNSSYKTRDSPEYKLELGNTIVNFARIVPDGLLVFFPSYHLLNSCIDAWQALPPRASVSSTTVWERISKFKQPVVEPRESALFNQANETFRAKLSDPSSTGAIFFAVCRGKVSEGLDFADRAGRAVVVTGIPYAMKTDPKVQLKREYLDETNHANSSNSKGLAGEEWYVQQAARAVNQAVGRVIRHRNDFGAIILCDERFSQVRSQGQMSLWLRPHIKCYSKFGDAAFTLTRFFRDRAVVDLSAIPSRHTNDMSTKVIDPPLDHVPRFFESGKTIQGINSGGIHVKHFSEPVTRAIDPSTDPSFSLFQTGAFKDFDTKHVHQDGKNTDFFARKTTMTLGQTSASTSYGAGDSAKISRAAVSSTRINNQPLSTLSIISANCAVGSSTGFVRESDSGVARQCVQGSLTSIKRQFIQEPFEKPWSLSKHVKTDLTNQNTLGEERQMDSSLQNSDTSRVKNRSESAPGECGEGAVGGNLPAKPCLKICKNQGPHAGQVQLDLHSKAQPSAQKVTKAFADGKETNAASFLQEVKAHLSILEYSRFRDCMKGLKNQVMSMATLLEAVTNLFSAPERLFLLRRFGDFIPTQHRKLYEEFLTAKCAELECQSGPPLDANPKAEESAQICDENSLKSLFTSKSRKSIGKK